MRNNNEKNLNYKFSENNAVDYITLVKKKRTQNKNLKIKREYQILLKKIKNCKFLFEKTKFKRRQNVNAALLQRAIIL